MPHQIKPNKAESQMTLASARSSSLEERPQGCWASRTRLEKVLMLVSTLVMFVVVALGLSMAAVISGFDSITIFSEKQSMRSAEIVQPHRAKRSIHEILDELNSTTLLEEPTPILRGENLVQLQTRIDLLSDKLRQIKNIVDDKDATMTETVGGGKTLESGQTLTNSIVPGKKPVTQNGICLDPGCVVSAAKLIANIDDSVSPCDDFFDYACGNFLKRKYIPEEKSAVTQFSEVSDKLHENLRLLVEADNSPTEPPSTKMVKKLYKSCMATEKIQSQGLTPLKDILKQMGGWPAVEGPTWNDTSFDWVNNTYINKRLGYTVDLLVDFSVTTNIKNTSWRIIDIDQPTPGMPSRKYLLRGLNDSDVQAYLEYQVSLAELLGANRTDAMEQLTESLKFEIKIANFTLPKEQRRNATKLYNKMTIAELQTLVSNIPWLEYINTILHPFVTVTETEEVVVNVPSYVEDLGRLLKDTPKRVIANYMLWRISAASITHLSDDARQLQLNYSKKITGTGKRQPRWKECMGIVSGSLSHAVGKLYAEKFFKKEAKVAADEMVSYIRAEFDKILRTVDWMDDETRVRAINKSLAITPHIAYPEELLNEAKLEELYAGLHITDGELLSNMRNLTIFGTNYSFRRLREKVNKNDWKNHGAAAVVNAFYSPLENSIQFPAGILQGTFFSAERPKYLNYGAIGFVIGHEITHGFDDMGRQFDYRGDLKEWWEPETRSKFIEKSKCIIYQYGNYTAPEVNMTLNGLNTQGENIADNGGIKEAYYAYQQWSRDHGEEKPLPGLQLSPKQLFWVSAANVWCGKYRPETLKLRILTGHHSPARFRVNGPLQNLEEFSKDWKCPLGSKMNPVHKCTLW